MDLRLGVEVDRAEDARETEKVLILQPGGAAALVDFHTDAVDAFPQAGGQFKLRGGEAILGIAHEHTVAPQVERLLHPLEADADPLAPQPFLQRELLHIAAHRRMVPVDLGRAQSGPAVPGIEGVGVLHLAVALQFDVPRHPDGAEGREVRPFPPEIRRTGGGAFAPGETPLAVQALAQAAAPGGGFLRGAVADMVGMGVQPVDGKNCGVGQPAQLRFFCVHGQAPFYRRAFFVLYSVAPCGPGRNTPGKNIFPGGAAAKFSADFIAFHNYKL